MAKPFVLRELAVTYLRCRLRSLRIALVQLRSFTRRVQGGPGENNQKIMLIAADMIAMLLFILASPSAAASPVPDAGVFPSIRSSAPSDCAGVGDLPTPAAGTKYCWSGDAGWLPPLKVRLHVAGEPSIPDPHETSASGRTPPCFAVRDDLPRFRRRQLSSDFVTTTRRVSLATCRGTCPVVYTATLRICGKGAKPCTWT